MLELEEGFEVEVEVDDVMGGVSLTGADGLSSLGGDEDHSQPISMLIYKWYRIDWEVLSSMFF